MVVAKWKRIAVQDMIRAVMAKLREDASSSSDWWCIGLVVYLCRRRDHAQYAITTCRGNEASLIVSDMIGEIRARLPSHHKKTFVGMRLAVCRYHAARPDPELVVYMKSVLTGRLSDSSSSSLCPAS